MATGWDPCDSAGNHSEIEEVKQEINDVKAQVRKAEAAVEQATQDRNAVRATLREIAKKMNQSDLSEQERAALIAEQQLCVADLRAAEKDLERLSRKEERLSRKEERLSRKEEQLRKKEEKLREEKLQQDDDIIVQRADVSRKFTGQVVHERKNPDTGKVCQARSCVIVIASKYAATFAHYRKWKEGQDVELEICSTDTTSMRAVKAKVYHIDPRVDFVILKFTGEELQAPDAYCGPRDGMKFYGHGLSCPGGTANVYHGVIASAEMVSHGHIALDRLSGKGDSGGGIFSAATGRLLGMMVGRDKDREKSYIVPAAVLLAAAVEETFDPDPPPSDQLM